MGKVMVFVVPGSFRLCWRIAGAAAVLLCVVVLASCSSPAKEPSATAPAAASGVPAREGQGATGTIVAISGSRITLDTRLGPKDVNVLPTTVVMVSLSVSQSELAVGDTVAVSGSSESGVLVASRVSVRPDGLSLPSMLPQGPQIPSGSTFVPRTDMPTRTFPGGPGAVPPGGGFGGFGGGGLEGGLNRGAASASLGEISAMSNSTITVNTQQAEPMTYLLASGTIFERVSVGGAGDLRVGERVTVAGSADAAGVIQASFLSIEQPIQ